MGRKKEDSDQYELNLNKPFIDTFQAPEDVALNDLPPIQFGASEHILERYWEEARRRGIEDPVIVKHVIESVPGDLWDEWYRAYFEHNEDIGKADLLIETLVRLEDAG